MAGNVKRHNGNCNRSAGGKPTTKSTHAVLQTPGLQANPAMLMFSLTGLEFIPAGISFILYGMKFNPVGMKAGIGGLKFILIGMKTGIAGLKFILRMKQNVALIAQIQLPLAVFAQ